ncbi:uncharacterized protein LOC143556346 [Bidens hawaiensis]|uniref:uncharacterized protein LOC143556346 n=1 Tax=Bidens hawaiensis TaxID=980011 RepID=UPI004049E733
MKITKEEWRGINVQYNGPITFLVMLYTHEYQKKYGPFGTPVTTPAVNYITTTTLNKMEKYLANNGPPLEEYATEVAAIKFSVDGKGIDAAATAPAAVTVSAAGKGLDETADAAVADTAAVIVMHLKLDNADQTAEQDLDDYVSDYSPLSLQMPIMLVDYYLTPLQLAGIN